MTPSLPIPLKRDFSAGRCTNASPPRNTNMYQLHTFRYSLIRVRENAESIAFYGGVQQELNEIQRRFGKALDNFDRVIRAQRNLEFFTTGYRYLIQVGEATMHPVFYCIFYIL